MTCNINDLFLLDIQSMCRNLNEKLFVRYKKYTIFLKIIFIGSFLISTQSKAFYTHGISKLNSNSLKVQTSHTFVPHFISRMDDA